MDVYDEIAQDATASVREAGATVTVARTEQDGSVTGMTWFVVYEKIERVEAPASFSSMENVRTGDWRLIVAPLDATGSPVEPREGDVLDLRDGAHAVVAFEAVQPGGKPVLFYVWARIG
ncbi:head-tail attachment protein [Microcystis phage Me-ZS1]|nr:head-tail attachment protein [Microcystis phage Me-ZS1]